MKSIFPKTRIAMHIGIALAASSLMVACAGNSSKKTEQAAITEAQPLEVIATSAEQKQPVTPLSVEVETAKPESVEQAETVIPEDSSAQPDIAEIQKPEKQVFQFGFDKAELSDSDKDIIKQHAEYLQQNPQSILTIKGHTDHHGPKLYNEYLSKKRADAIASILIDEGVNESQLKISALANDEPLQGINDTRKNRRVELNYVEMNMATSTQ